MNPEANEVLAQFKQQQQESQVETTTVEVNAEVNQPKAATKESDTLSVKKEEKTGIFEIPKRAFNWVKDNVYTPAKDFIVGGYYKVKGHAINRYETEKALYKELGFTRYVLDRMAKLGLGLMKIGAVATLAWYLQSYVMATFQISLFSPAVMGIILVAALAMIIIKSVLTQKDSGAPFSAKATGSHIVEDLLAA